MELKTDRNKQYIHVSRLHSAKSMIIAGSQAQLAENTLRVGLQAS